MTRWELRQVPFKFQLSDLTLFDFLIPLQVRAERLVDNTAVVSTFHPPVHELIEGSQGFVVRGLPIQEGVEVLTRTGDYYCYVPSQYKHCYIDLRQSFDQYKDKFSSKTRSTISRKIKKYATHCGGTLLWKSYKTPSEMREFFKLARIVSSLSYQKRLLDVGLPESEDFICKAETMASQNRVRAYLLFDGERPVSYLYCPVAEGVVSYSYVGYDPEYIDMSVGLVLQWLAVEDLFLDASFLYFDFTEGQSDHKRLFSTHQRQCGNVFMVRRSLGNATIIYGHMVMDRLSVWLGEAFERLGVKAKVKRLLRFGR